jgi:hypothetical protein
MSRRSDGSISTSLANIAGQNLSVGFRPLPQTTPKRGPTKRPNRPSLAALAGLARCKPSMLGAVEDEPGPNSEYVALGRVRLGGCHGEDSKRAAELVGLNNPRAAEIGATRARAAPCAAIRALPLLLHGASL